MPKKEYELKKHTEEYYEAGKALFSKKGEGTSPNKTSQIQSDKNEEDYSFIDCYKKIQDLRTGLIVIKERVADKNSTEYKAAEKLSDKLNVAEKTFEQTQVVKDYIKGKPVDRFELANARYKFAKECDEAIYAHSSDLTASNAGILNRAKEGFKSFVTQHLRDLFLSANEALHRFQRLTQDNNDVDIIKPHAWAERAGHFLNKETPVNTNTSNVSAPVTKGPTIKELLSAAKESASQEMDAARTRQRFKDEKPEPSDDNNSMAP